MGTAETEIAARNREIGRVLYEARSQHHRTVTECATLIGTSRRRYTAMERGEATIGVAELEKLMDYLHVPAQTIWRAVQPGRETRQVVVQAHPGETVQVVVEVQPLP